MSVAKCTRRIQFAAGHRVYGHESKCGKIHGHNYVALFKARAHADQLDSIGRVIDFSVLKERIGRWIDTNWDHGLILYKNDPLQRLFVSNELLVDQKVFIAPFNPTAEEMALYLLDNVCPLLLTDTHVTVTKVTLWETENCYAEATLL